MSVSNCCISQGSVATYLRYGGNYYTWCVGNFSLQQCKNFWNRLRFDKIIAKVRDHSFFGTQCMCPSHMRTHYALHPGCLSIRLSPVPVRKAGTHWRQSRLLPIQSTLLFVLATNRQQFNSTSSRGRLNCRYGQLCCRCGRLCRQCVPGLTQQQRVVERLNLVEMCRVIRLAIATQFLNWKDEG